MAAVQGKFMSIFFSAYHFQPYQSTSLSTSSLSLSPHTNFTHTHTHTRTTTPTHTHAHSLCLSLSHSLKVISFSEAKEIFGLKKLFFAREIEKEQFSILPESASDIFYLEIKTPRPQRPLHGTNFCLAEWVSLLPVGQFIVQRTENGRKFIVACLLLQTR